jgi:hypothetical protein
MERGLRLTLVVLSIAGIVVALCVLAGMGCAKPQERLNAPPQGHTERPNKLQEPFVYMTDNALLADMSMSAVHFVPHQAELNANGVRRLKRYVQILKIYGGTLRYDGVSDAAPLVQGRMEQIKEFLLAQGLEPDRVQVKRALAGGEGMNASEAIVVREAANFKPEQTSGGGPTTPAAGGSGQASAGSGTTGSK